MKKILYLSIILITVFSLKSFAATSATLACLTDSLHKKIKHPTIAMTDAQLNGILNAMRQKRNDAEKIIVLKDGIKDKGIRVDQLITLLNQFALDESKLTCAEYAWPYTVDYKNMLKIQDYFAEESNKGALEDYVRKHK